MRIINPTAKLGEDLAVKYLQKNGYKIIQRNFKERYGEIDIIAIDSTPQAATEKDSNSKVLVFIEVKTRKSRLYGSPLEAITYWKLKSILKTAQYYKITHPSLPESMRIDAVAIELSKDNTVEKIALVKNISG